MDKKLAHDIVVDVLRKLVASKLDFLSPPLLREFCNTVMIMMGQSLPHDKKIVLEKYRLKYQRIGIPRFDLKEMKKENKINKNYCFFSDINIQIALKVLFEFDNVEKLIEERGG